jgi:serine protease Do
LKNLKYVENLEVNHPNFGAARAQRLNAASSCSWAAWLAAVFIAFGFTIASVAANAKAAPDSFADLAKELLPAVVNISTAQTIEGRDGPQIPQFPPGSPFEEFFKEFFERNRPQQRQRRITALGSGFIVESNSQGESYVVTNNHVIAEADKITVILHDGIRLEAELIGRDPRTDLAVLKVKSKNKLKTISFGDSDTARVGDWVIAIGNPFGLGGTVTAGIISAHHRDINSGPYDDFIQTDASINRGNSGGPMFNIKGEVIGINSAIYSPSGGSVGIGFAIPSSTARQIISQLIKHGLVRRGWLGVRIQTVNSEIAETLGLEKAEGALVANVIEDGPAEKATIQAGDVILEFDGKPISKMRGLPRLVAGTEIDKEVSVVIWRDSKKVRLQVTVGKLEESSPQVAARSGGGAKENKLTVKQLGLTMSSVTNRLRDQYKLGKGTAGVVVTSVEEGGVAAGKGIRPGDLIVEVSQRKVSQPVQVVSRIDEARKSGRKSVLFLVEGQGGLRFIALRIDQG